MAFNKTELLEKIDSRFDGIEKLLQLLLMNNLINDVDRSLMIMDETADLRIGELLEIYGCVFGGFKSIFDVEILVVEIPDDVKIKSKELCALCAEIRMICPDKEPFFMFDSINGMQRKRILQDKISFGVKSREIYIVSTHVA